MQGDLSDLISAARAPLAPMADSPHNCRMPEPTRRVQLAERLTNLGSAVVGLLVTPWGLIGSGALAVWAATTKTIFGLSQDAHVVLAVQAFVFVFWTLVGVRFLIATKRNLNVNIIPDLRYGISPESYSLQINEKSQDNALVLGFVFRNHTNSAIRVEIEQFRVVIGDRVCPDAQIREMVLPRIGTRLVRSNAFRKDVVKDNMEAILEFKVIYGEVERSPSRRFHFRARVHMAVSRDAKRVITGYGITDEHLLWEDTPI